MDKDVCKHEIHDLCAERFKKSEESDGQIIKLLECLDEKIEEMHNRLFVDNGRPSFQSRLNRVCRVQNAAIWIVGAIFTIVVLGVSARLIYDAVCITS